MKTSLLRLSLVTLLIVAGCDKQRPDPKSALRVAGAPTLSSFDPPVVGEKTIPAKAIKFDQAEIAEVMKFYAEISGRSVICAANLPAVKVTFSNQTPMSPVEVLQALDSVLAAQGVTTVFLGTQYVKVVSEKEARVEPAPVIELRPDQLPDSSSYLIYIVKLKKVSAQKALPVLAEFAKLPNSLIAIGSGGTKPPKSQGTLPQLVGSIFPENNNSILILRDYSSSVRRMLQVLEKMEQE